MAWGSRAFSIRSVAWLLALITGAVVIAIALPASAATLTFTPTADTIVNEASPSSNTGTSTALRVDGGSDPDVQSYLRFSVTGVSGTVQSAKLRVWATSPTANGPSVFTTASTWAENTLTWANKPALSGSGVGKVTSIATSTWAEFDVSSIVGGNGTYDLVLAGTSTDGVDFQSREATNKPQLVITTQTGNDTTPPSAPTNLSATAVSSSRIDLSWTAATDNVGVTGYEIFRGATSVATIGTATTYSDSGLSPATSYSYTVRARDAAGNWSDPSASAGATTQSGSSAGTFTPTADTVVNEASPSSNTGTSTALRVDGGSDPDVQSYLRFSVTGVSGTVQSAKLRVWATSPTANGPSVFTTASTWAENTLTWANKPALSGSGVGKVTSIATSTWAEFDVSSIVGGNGTYDLVLAGTSTDGVDFQSREATNKPQLVITTQTGNDTTPPSAPTNLSATAVSSSRIDLSWTAATDNVGVTGYEIFRGATSVATIGTATTYSDSGLSPATSYSYAVRARDAAGNWSDPSASAGATTLDDTTPPSAPTNLVASAVSASRVHLTWSAATDNVGVTGYEIIRDGTSLTTVGAVTSYNDDTVAGATSYVYRVKALDAAGNASAISGPANVTTPDGSAPSTPTGLTATATSTRVDLSWTASTDDVAVTGYEISRGGSPIATIGAVTTYADTTVGPNTSYTYRVRALDGAGNLSSPSDPATVTTPGDTVAPSAPTNLTAGAGTSGGIDLAWTAATDNVAVTNYEIFRDGSLLTTVGPVTTYTDTTAGTAISYTYKVRAMDAANNRSGFSNEATAAATDTQAPSAPTNLLATAVNAARIDLSWTAATDNVAVTNYAVYRGGALLTTIGNVTTYSDTAVTAGTLYSYQVKALDARGNTSGFSNSSSATTPQQLTTLNPTADARVEEANPSSNFGTISPLRVDGGNGVHVETYLSFTASGLIGSVRHATLRLYALSGTGDGPIVSPAGTSWTETGITWANKPAATGSPIVDLGGIATGTWVDIDVTALVQGNGTYAFQLTGQSTDGVDFHSKEATNKPQLVLTMGAQDTQAPTAPTSLNASAGSPTQVDLTWNGSTDDVAVANYVVYRGTTLVATIGPTATEYSDTTASPNTTYTYTVKARDPAGNVSNPSNAVTIKTPTQTVAPVIAAAGDIACANTDANYNGGAGTSAACRQLYTSNLLVNGGFAAVLPLGDNQYNSGSLSQYQAVYNPTWGRVKSITHPVTGNHEYGTSGASGYFNYFGSAAGDPSKGYYSFDIGSWHLIALNSNCSIVACTNNSAQETWLRQDLAAHPTQCTLAFDHHARWSSGHDGDNTFMQPMWQDLYDANADVFLSGHSHNYERFAPQNATGGLDNARGIRQFVVGTGGAFFTGIGSPHANSQVRNNDTFGFLKLTLRPTSYDWQFVPEAGKTFTDSGSTACH